MGMQAIPLKLDITRNLRIGTQAMSLVKKMLGKTIDKVDLNDIDELLMVVYVGLVHEDKTLTIEKLSELIDEHSDLETVLEALTDAMLEGYGKNAKKAAKEAREKAESSVLNQPLKLLSNVE